MPTVPTNDNNQPSPVGGGNGGNGKPSDAYMLMAAATMYRQGRLTEDQQPTFDNMTNTERAARGIPPQGAQGEEYGDIPADMPKTAADIKAISSGIKTGDTSQQRRSEDVEDKRARGAADYVQSQADLLLARQKAQPYSQPTAEDVQRTSMAGTRKGSRSVMAKQLGIRDIDAFSDFIDAQLAKEAEVKQGGMARLKAVMKEQ